MRSDPTPAQLGFPAKFHEWRPGQWEAIESVAGCNERFDAHAIPTGGGKTGTYIGAGIISMEPGDRFAIITETKALQKQILDDFQGTLPIVNIEGKANYPCTGRPGWTCEDGHAGQCPNRGTESCTYSKQYFRALTSPFVLTNYSYWMSVHKYGFGLGTFKHLFMDEAHSAFDNLSNAIQIQISTHEIEEMLEQGWPDVTDNIAIWKAWAGPMRKHADVAAKKAGQKISNSREAKQSWVREFHHYRNLVRKLGTLATLRPENWVVDEWEHGFQFDIIRPSRFAESMLFQKIPRVSLFSATCREKTLNMIGVRDDYSFYDYPSTFDPDGNPVMHIPTAYIDHKSSSYDITKWMMRADAIIQRRLDRRGIFHTVSYERRDKIMEMSDWKQFMLTNRKGEITSKIAKQYRDKEPPVLLVSPSFGTGFDFPYDECRYQIIGKVPWPDMRSKLMAARSQYDPQYGAYIAMMSLVQQCGRGRRADDDWCENFVIDDHFIKFVVRNRSLAPNWFLDLIRWERQVPSPRRLAA